MCGCYRTQKATCVRFNCIAALEWGVEGFVGDGNRLWKLQTNGINDGKRKHSRISNLVRFTPELRGKWKENMMMFNCNMWRTVYISTVKHMSRDRDVTYPGCMRRRRRCRLRWTWLERTYGRTGWGTSPSPPPPSSRCPPPTLRWSSSLSRRWRWG